MPIYLYQNPETGEVKEIVQGMNDKHEYHEGGKQYKRVYTVPQASIDTKINPFSQNSFLEKTKGRGTIGDLMDRSRDLSEERTRIIGEGRDDIKNKFFDDWSSKRGGKKHTEDKRPTPNKKIKDGDKKS